MFRLHKNKAAKSGERIDFKFSQFKALQVPKGWDKLFVSIISVETGKTIAKSSKASSRTGTCQWTETVSESIWVPQHVQSSSSKELEDCLYKLVLAMGSSRSGILGEALINMATYMSSSDPVQVSFPLKKCNHGTILQLKIQCLTPKLNLRDSESKETNSHTEDLNTNSQDAEMKSDESDNSLAKSARSYSSRDLGSAHQGDNGTKGEGGVLQEEAGLSSSSQHSYNSAENSIGTESFFPSGEHTLIARQESTSSQNSVPPGSYNAEDASQSDNSSFNSRITHSENLSADDPQEFAAQSLRISGSSKSLLEAAEATIKDLRSEAKKWEKNARKAMLDLEMLRKEHTEQSKYKVNLDMQLSAAYAERDGLQKEVEQLKLLLEKSKVKAGGLEDSTFQDEGVTNVIKELEDEIKFQKESTANLSLLLNRSQESNVELVSVLQELEETVEKQKAEIENLSTLQSKFSDMESSIQVNVLQMQKLQESEKNLQAQVQELEKALEEIDGSERVLITEIETLKAKLQEVESDCQELTEENLELLVKIKEMRNNSAQVSEHESQIHDLEEKIRRKVVKEIEDDYNLSIQELENLKYELESTVTELSEKREEIERLETGLLSKEEEIGNLKNYQRKLEDKLSVLQREKSQLEENVEIVIRENDIATKCLNDLRKDLMVLGSSVDTNVSANKTLERKSSKQNFKIHLSELEQENGDLLACISGLETQIRNLTDANKSMVLELQDSKFNVVKFQDETAKLRNEMETQKMDAEKKLEEMHDLMEESSSLQKSNEELKKQKLELKGHCDRLEMKLKDLHRNFADCSKRVNVLQENISSLLEDSASKERSLTSEIDALLKENEKQKKKLSELDQMHFEKMVQVENLQREVGELYKKLSVTEEERDRIASDSANEASSLRKNITKLESELHASQTESKEKIQDLMDELASSKQNQEMLKADNGKMLKLLENYKLCEEKFKTALNGVELKLTVSEYEKQQLIEESTNLKAQLLKIGTLQDEVLALKNEVNAIKTEKEKLEISLNLKAEDCKELNIEKNLFIDKITDLQKTISELEEFKEDNLSLEEKIQKLESELIAKESLCEQDADVKNELNHIKRANKQLQQQIQQLEEVKEKSTRRIQILEEELIILKEKQRNPRKKEGDNPVLEDELSKAMEANNAFKVQVKRLTAESRKGRTGSPRKSKAESEVVPKEKFERTKSSLETELKELRERYFNMSLKYAEVEAQREELVMKLKATNNGKRWF
ncbi:hypothetical protein JCGZ_16604 [Jatropha curcas]|uniref:C2 NT-type domain-containing protein n=1 Tax=Jatropha curcas TaxID=180498 RepID=A0A067KAF1_JATCU|nr:myosin-11 [Jatropha curcas]KDP29215.1 hypothetical protein JCGZ_16604 [Jatropha curcas]